MDDKRAKLPAKINPEKIIDQTDARLIARLTQLVNTPGISDKDRKLLERNLQRLRGAVVDS